ncbi:hypothetical protein BN2476_420120 [Paraburkholderia piptadeniae]|uniref:Uncharacterized protein n=1 Tax=Paraburkholderia piptadeniae TaxID=1701573 RepID=A0A1N7SBH1_9BURK|nr:hypothetical protein BN2476_420120 [Paraburkholderia piptadeniae]
MYSRTTVPLPSVVSRTVYDAEVLAEEDEADAAEPADALRITATPDGAGTVWVVALDPAGGVIGLPPRAALAGCETSRPGSAQHNPSAEKTAARLKLIDMVIFLPPIDTGQC